MNVRDSEEVTGLLLGKGYALAESEETADVLLYNTCAVRDHAEDKVWSELGRVRAMKRARPELVVGVMGCMAQSQRESIFRRAPQVDFISGPAQLYDVPELIESILEERRPMAAIREKRRAEFQAIAYHAGRVTALVTVMEGCDKVCSYCIVPYTRGPEVSRPPEQVVAEVEDLARRGYREVTLLGQNVNSYGRRFPGENGSARRGEESGFPGLLRRVNGIPGIERIRIITSHPSDAVEGLFAAMRDLDRVCEHLHLPVQSGSDRVLERMRRGYTAGEYLEKLAMLRRIVPGAAVSTDLMVGFPGETAEDFEATLRLTESARFDSAFIFKYSPRPFASSARWGDDVSEEEKNRRLQSLLRLQERISREEAERRVGQEVEVLVEEPGMGRTRTNRKAYFPGGSEAAGDLVNVRVEGVRGQSFMGRVTRP